MDNVIEKIIEQYKGKVGAVISSLEAVQEIYGYLPREVLEKISEELDVHLSLLFSLATFYSAFTLKPRGKHTVHVCLGTACHVRGGRGYSKGFRISWGLNRAIRPKTKTTPWKRSAVSAAAVSRR